MLAARPAIERDRWARLVLGRGWTGGTNEVGGPRSWPPLHYVCHSCFASTELARSCWRAVPTRTRSSRTSTARCRRSTGAAGVVHDPELTRVLLKAGADPNGEPQFGDALYHSVEAESSECLRLLLEHGARPRRSNALAHALDDHRPEHVRLLLDAGADANEGCSLLHHAAWVGNPIVVRRLLERGADPVAHSGADFDTPLAWAVHGSSGWAIEGRDYVAAAGLLVAAGAALEPRFLNAAEGPLEAWLRERAHGAQAMLDGDG